MQAKPSRTLPARRRLALGLGLGAAVLVLGWSLAWLLLAQQLEAGLANWVQARRAEGWQVAHAEPRRGGWPWAAALHLPDVTLADPQGLGWQSAALELRLVLPLPRRLALEASGPQAVLVGGARWPGSAGLLRGWVPLVGEGEAELQAEALRLEAGPALQRGWLRLQRSAEGTPVLALSLEGMELPGAALPLGPAVERVSLRAGLVGRLPGAGAVARRAAAWRDDQGRLELRDATLIWGPLRAEGDATLRLDQALQPVGQADLALTGLPETLRALAAAGALPARSASGLGTMAALMARPGPNGGPPRLQVPLAVADRRLSLAGFTLLTLPPLAWPAE